MTLTVFGHYGSQPTRAVLWALNLHGVPFAFRKVEPLNLTGEFVDRFPTGLVPAIELERPGRPPLKLSESNAILPFLAEHYGWADWYPEAGDASPDAVAQRATVNQWLHWHHHALRPASVHFYFPVLYAFRASQRALSREQQDLGLPQQTSWAEIAAPAEEPVLDAADEFRRGRAVLRDSFQTIKYGAFVDGASGERIPGAAFLCGGKPTVADVAAYCELDQLEAMGVLEALGPDVVPAEITEWMGRMRAIAKHDDVRRTLFKLVDCFHQDPAGKKALRDGIEALEALRSEPSP